MNASLVATITLVDRWMLLGPSGRAGLAIILLGILLILGGILVPGARRARLLVVVVALVLIATGYVVYDKKHIVLNLSIHEAQTLRDDCERLIDQRADKEPNLDVWLAKEELPASLRRFGATSAMVTPGQVRIILEGDGNSSRWGLLYDAQQWFISRGAPYEVRPTWHRDLYEFWDPGE